MNKEKPDPKDMYTFAMIVNDLRTKSSVADQEATEVGIMALKIADLIDKCVFCVAIRHDIQPSFVDLIIRHFNDKHLVDEK